MIIIEAALQGHELSIPEPPVMASGSVRVDRVHYDFDSAWEGLEKWGVFVGSDKKAWATKVGEDDCALIPWEVLAQRSKIKIGVYGTEAGSLVPRITSTLVKVTIPEGAWSDDFGNSGDPTPTMIEEYRAAAFQAIEDAVAGHYGAVVSLNTVPLIGERVYTSVGVPEYVDEDHLAQYAAYGLTESGWYTFARIFAPRDCHVTAETSVEGAAGAAMTVGEDHVDVAVRFGVTAQSVLVTLDWGGVSERYLFKASDLGVRNLDYRTTFYIYDLAECCEWSYALTTDAAFVADKAYYTEEGGVYMLAEVTAGEAIPAGMYYVHSKVRFAGMTRNVTYKLDIMVDCPIEIELPEVEDGSYGAWFELQTRFSGSFSVTLLPPEGIKIGTVQTQAQSAGINVIDLQYSDVCGVKMWSLLNTHSNIPA